MDVPLSDESGEHLKPSMQQRNEEGGIPFVSASYQRLWELLKQRNMKKKDLEELSGLSHYVINNKLTQNKTVTTETLEKICKALGCTMNDILEFVPDRKV